MPLRRTMLVPAVTQVQAQVVAAGVNRTCACLPPVPPQGVRRKASLSGLRIAFAPVPALPTGAGKKARRCRQVQVAQNRYVIPAPHRSAGRESN